MDLVVRLKNVSMGWVAWEARITDTARVKTKCKTSRRAGDKCRAIALMVGVSGHNTPKF